MTRLIPIALLFVALPARAADEQDFFSAKVRPILAGHCFKCHGPHDEARKAKMRLDLRDEALKPARSGSAPIIPGKPDDSEMIARIFATEANRVMPPPAAKLALSDEQKQILKRWIAEGAEYRQHWAFVAPRKVSPPAVKQTDWPRNPLDRFILARMEKEGLTPSPEADRYTLIRRVSLDLIGLPPTPEEVAEFVGDTNPQAYERLVDRLLASPAYGERWGRRWLDLARYADTNGYEKDRPRSIWPYRDWVIDALNADLPFDRFTVEQIAGDMLPGATEEQRIATGFHRNTMLNEEGGIDPLEFRFHAMTDRVATTGATWLGLTLGCAQCHTHKFDPVPHREYYQTLAFLNNADEPVVDVHSPDIAAKRKEIEAKIAALVAGLPDRFPAENKPDDQRPEEVRRREHLEKKFKEWADREGERSVRWTVLKPTRLASNLPELTVQDDNSVFVSGDMSKRDLYTLTFRSDLEEISALRLEVLPDERLPKHGPGRVYYEGPIGDFFLSELTLMTDGAKRAEFAGASHSFASGNLHAKSALDGDPQTGWSINGGQGRAHTAVFNLKEPLKGVKEFYLHLLFERYFAAGLGRFRVSITADPRGPIARQVSPETEELLLVPTEKRTEAQKKRLLEAFVQVAPELTKERAEIEQLRKQMPAYPTTLVMSEWTSKHPRPTYIQKRGEFLQPGERVEPATLSVLPPLPRDAPRNRLGYARWLVARDNPLTARVTVNRQWAALLGTGLVKSTEDFGYQGEFPSHPDLLDWLAVEFMGDPAAHAAGSPRGWGMKDLHRLIVTSATYRQSSRVTANRRAKDPDNRLLSRGPRVRLEAEQVRDAALRASGLLATKLGGPSVFPPQPPGVTTEGAYGRLEWKVSEGPDRYRRGLYTFMKRTTPYAMFATFDGPSGEVCVGRREVSNTPLQALTLLNDPVFVEAAQALARQAISRNGTVEERVEWLFRRVLTRPPEADERNRLAEFWRAQKERFEKKEADAAKVAGVGTGDVNERAAWAALARALFNLDEAIVRE